MAETIFYLLGKRRTQIFEDIFLFFRLWLPISQSAFIFIQFYREYLFVTINFKEILENINIFFPSLYETPLPFFNYIIIKEISGFFLDLPDTFYVTGIWPKKNHQTSVK